VVARRGRASAEAPRTAMYIRVSRFGTDIQRY
jgi:hypothetical protein